MAASKAGRAASKAADEYEFNLDSVTSRLDSLDVGCAAQRAEKDSERLRYLLRGAKEHNRRQQPQAGTIAEFESRTFNAESSLAWAQECNERQSLELSRAQSAVTALEANERSANQQLADLKSSVTDLELEIEKHKVELLWRPHTPSFEAIEHRCESMQAELRHQVT